MQKLRGFSVIELLILTAIATLLAEIMIPNFLRAKISADEASAISSLRAINAAERTYQVAYPATGYAALGSLGGGTPCLPSSANACLIDNELAKGAKGGYNFAAAAGNPVGGRNTTYTVGSAPTSYSHSGIRLFCSTQDNTIRWDANESKTTAPPNGQQCLKFNPLL